MPPANPPSAANSPASSAWSGNSSGFVETIVNLTNTARFAGHTLRLRWRIATNGSIASTGWYVDSMALFGGGDLSNNPPVVTTAASTSSTETVTDPDSTVYQIIRGSATNLTVTATDDAGESSLNYTWAVTSGPAPVFFPANASNAAKTTSANFEATGDYQISVAVRDAQGLTVTSAVNARVEKTTSGLMVSPAAVILTVGASQTFSATLVDQFGVSLASQPSSFGWSASGGGTINSTGVFSAGAAGGPYVITASSGGFSNTANVTVSPAPATVSLGNLNQTYSGGPKTVTVTTSPPGLSVTVTYNSASALPIDAGSYAGRRHHVTDPELSGFRHRHAGHRAWQ